MRVAEDSGLVRAAGKAALTDDWIAARPRLRPGEKLQVDTGGRTLLMPALIGKLIAKKGLALEAGTVTNRPTLTSKK